MTADQPHPLVAAGSDDGLVRLYDASQSPLRLAATLDTLANESPMSAVTSLAFSGAMLDAVQGAAGRLSTFDLGAGPLPVAVHSVENPSWLSSVPGGRLLLAHAGGVDVVDADEDRVLVVE